jgi:hypothetical protein
MTPLIPASSHTDQGTPDRGKTGTDQKIDGMPAKRVAIRAHLGAEPAEMAVIGRVEKTGQSNEKA